MPLTLHEALIPSYRQYLSGVRAMVDKAENFANENDMPASELFEAKLADDMWPLPFHIRSVWVHSKMALDLVPTGEFSPDFKTLPQNWDEMRAMVDDALEGIEQVSVEYLEAIADKQLDFKLGGKVIWQFTVQNFLLSFSQPNFYFHATTFYDILRMKGLPLGKRDYLFAPRIIGA